MQKQSNAFKKKHSGHKELYVKHNSSVNQPYTRSRIGMRSGQPRMSIVKLLDSRLGHPDGILKSVCPDMGYELNMVLPRIFNFRSRFWAKIDDLLRKI